MDVKEVILVLKPALYNLSTNSNLPSTLVLDIGFEPVESIAD